MRAFSCWAGALMLLLAAVGSGGAERRGSDLLGAAAPGAPLVVTPERVVSLVPAITETIVAFGGASRLVARTRFDTAAALAHLPSVGGALNPDLEALVSLRPDLVIIWEHGEARALASTLTALGIATYAGEARSIEDFRRHARALGELLGRGAAADALVRRVDRTLARHAAGAPDGARPTVMFVLWPQPLLTTGAGTFIDELIRLVGARGAFEDVQAPWPTVSFEQAIVRNPDLVLVSSDAVPEPGTPTFLDDPRWEMLDAVRTGHVHVVDADLFTRPGPDMGAAAARLAQYLDELAERAAARSGP